MCMCICVPFYPLPSLTSLSLCAYIWLLSVTLSSIAKEAGLRVHGGRAQLIKVCFVRLVLYVIIKVRLSLLTVHKKLTK